jgi:predicted dehydrogenase/NADPH:quinone reductase-like Zn-dependent oxidoreductase
MRQLFLDKELVSIKEVCQPLLEDYSVLVSVSYSYLALGEGFYQETSSDRSMLGNIPQKIKQILTVLARRDSDTIGKQIQEKISGRVLMGASCSGTVIAIGKKVRRFRVGDWVACAGDGFAYHAGIVCIPENLIVSVPRQEDLKSASLVGMGAMALQSIRRAEIQLGDVVCVVGLCSLGQLIVQLCSAAGARVVAIDSITHRLALAKQLGAADIFDVNDPGLKGSLERVSGGNWFDKVIILPDSSSEILADFALEITRRKGKIVLVANNNVHFKKNSACQKEVDILFTYFHGPGWHDYAYEAQGNDYPYAFVRWTENRNMQLFASMVFAQRFSLDVLLENKIPLSQLTQSAATKKETIGLLLEYDGDSLEKSRERIPLADTFMPSKKDGVTVSFFGATRYVKNNILPAFSNVKGFSVSTIVDKDISFATRTANLYRGAIALSDEMALLEKGQGTDAIFFSAPHNAAFDNILLALKNNKIVFADHPVAISDQQVDMLDAVFREYPQSRLFVCYNRIHAPFIKKIKFEVNKASTPLMIFYRVNIASLDKMHRYFDRDGSIITYASHVVDVICHLVNSQPVSISVETVSQAERNIFPADNFAAIISFANGSVGNVMFSSVGNEEGCGERLEMFFDGKTIVMEDFLRLTGFGLSQTFDELVRIPDKGYEPMIQEYLMQVKQPTPELHRYLRRWNMVRKLTGAIDRLACQGGGELRF